MGVEHTDGCALQRSECITTKGNLSRRTTTRPHKVGVFLFSEGPTSLLAVDDYYSTGQPGDLSLLSVGIRE